MLARLVSPSGAELCAQAVLGKCVPTDQFLLSQLESVHLGCLSFVTAPGSQELVRVSWVGSEP